MLDVQFAASIPKKVIYPDMGSLSGLLKARDFILV